jgi:acyl dehydratase
MTAKEGDRGRFLEDFEVGDIYQSRIGRTITEADNTWFTLLTANTNQVHFNRHYAERTEWGRPLVNSTLTLAIVTGLTVPDVSQNGIALGWDEVRLPHPLFAGDTLYAETEVLEIRESRSRPEMGIVRTATRGVNQTGQTVIELTRTVMVWKRDAAPVDDLFPQMAPTETP